MQIGIMRAQFACGLRKRGLRGTTISAFIYTRYEHE